MLENAHLAFEKYEELYPATNALGGRYGDIGVIRLSLAIEDKEYRVRYGAWSPRFEDVERLLKKPSSGTPLRD
jgi:hypothetical protein